MGTDGSESLAEYTTQATLKHREGVTAKSKVPSRIPEGIFGVQWPRSTWRVPANDRHRLIFKFHEDHMKVTGLISAPWWYTWRKVSSSTNYMKSKRAGKQRLKQHRISKWAVRKFCEIRVTSSNPDIAGQLRQLLCQQLETHLTRMLTVFLAQSRRKTSGHKF